MGNAKLIADDSNHGFFDFAVSCDGTASSGLGIPVDRMISTLPIQYATVLFDVLDKVSTFHAAGVSIRIRSRTALGDRPLVAFSR